MARILLEAICSGNVALAADLIKEEKYGCVDSQTSRRDGTSLFFCCSRGYLDLALLLLSKNANVNARNKCSATPLHAAADNNRLKIVSVLLDRGAELDAQTQRGDTPLHLAAFRGHADVAQCLVERGANFLLPNESNMTPAMEAFSQGHLEVGQYLKAVQELKGPPSSSGPFVSSHMVHLDPPCEPSDSPTGPPSLSIHSLPPPIGPPPLSMPDWPTIHGDDGTAISHQHHHHHRVNMTSHPFWSQQTSGHERNLPTSTSLNLATDNTTKSTIHDNLHQRHHHPTHSVNHTSVKNPVESGIFSTNQTALPTRDKNLHMNIPVEYSRAVGGYSSGYPYQYHNVTLPDGNPRAHPSHCDHHLRSNSRQAEEGIDYSVMLSPSPATTFPLVISPTPKTNDSMSVPNASPTLHKTNIFSLPFEESNEISDLGAQSHGDANSVRSSGSDGSSCNGDARRNDFDAIHTISYPPPPPDVRINSNNDFPSPSTSYSRLPSTPSSVTSMELLDLFESSKFYQDSSSNSNQRSTSPMSLDGTSSDYSMGKRSVEISNKERLEVNEVVSDVRYTRGMSCDGGRCNIQNDRRHHHVRSSLDDDDFFVSNCGGSGSKSMNDLSSVKTKSTHSSLTVLNIPVGNQLQS